MLLPICTKFMTFATIEAMSRKSGKITGSILGALGAVLFIALAAAGTVFIFWYRTEDDSFPFLILAATCAVTAVLDLYLVRSGMRLYDAKYREAEKEKLGGRWVRNTLFAGMIVIFLTAAFVTVMETSIHGGDTGKVWRFIIFFLIAVCAAVVLYLKHTVRESRKRKIVNRLSQEAVLNPSGRFSMVIDRVYSSTEDQRYAYAGNVKGTLHTGDRVCVIQPDGLVSETTVTLIQRDNKILKKVSSSWTGGPPLLVILGTDRDGQAFLPYSVISGIRPTEADPSVNRLESPALRAYLCAYDEHVGNENFAAVLVDAIVHSRFLVPVVTKDQEIRDPSVILPEDTEYQYPTVSTAMLEGSEVVQVYTDWDALSGWGYLMDPTCLQGTKIMTFEELTSLVTEHYAGMVIDPFGPKHFYLSAPFLVSLSGRNEEEIPESVEE